MTRITDLVLTTLLLLSPLATVGAIPSDDLALTSNANSTLGTDATLEARGQQYCTCRADGTCNRSGGWKNYPCRNSNCKDKVDYECPLGRDEKGNFVAKCPNNELSYEWDWPWKSS